ncbi:gephyrin-like molybdotransferase Glp [Candidatus Riflebacteria bacterium]
MVSLTEALRLVLSAARPGGSEKIAIEDCLNRVLADDISSDLDMPPFNKAAMDGFACRMADLKNELVEIENLPAGVFPKKRIESNKCARIMTGGVVPDGADCVIKIEDTEKTTNGSVRFLSAKTAKNICLKGEDIKKGEIILTHGQLLKSQHIGLLSTVGCTQPPVACRAMVGIIATGNEIVQPSRSPQQAKIRDSNSIPLLTQVKSMGADARYFGIAPDTEEAIDEKFEQARRDCDVIIFTGGVSMGDYDLVPVVLKKRGIKILFEKVRVKPGNPTKFGIVEDIPCFGLPGNPVASFIMFELLVKPLLYKMMGHHFTPLKITGILGETVRKKKTDRESIIPVYFSNGKIYPTEYHGPAHTGSLLNAGGLISMPVGMRELQQGSSIMVRLL